jgi:acyl-CoA hydrolase
MSPAPGMTRLVDIVFPGDTNHHGTLFGGVGLAHMDKVAYIAAARHARVDFVTASCERINFDAPAQLGDIVELTGIVARVGRRSLSVELEFIAEAPLSGERRRCGHAVFNLVTGGGGLEHVGGRCRRSPPDRMLSRRRIFAWSSWCCRNRRAITAAFMAGMPWPPWARPPSSRPRAIAASPSSWPPRSGSISKAGSTKAK